MTSTSAPPSAPTTGYRKLGRAARVLNGMVAVLARTGISLRGTRLLEVRGRTSGQLRRTPVNLLTLDGREYLVSTRGEAQWVRNLRAADGELYLRLGRGRQRYLASELADADRVPVLRAYLETWNAQVKPFFGGVGPASADEEIAADAARHPVFVLARAD